MSVNPNLFDPTIDYPVPQPIFEGTPGPYEHGSDLYWVVLEQPADLGEFLNVVAYKSVDGGVTFTTFQALTFQNGGGDMCVSYPGTGTLIYFGWRGVESDAQHGDLHTATFDMATDTFSVANDPGVTISTGSNNGIYIEHLANGDTILVWIHTVAGTFEILARVYSSGSWSSDVTIYTSASVNTTLWVVVPIANSKIAVFYKVGTQVLCTIVDGTSAGSPVVAIASTSDFVSTQFPQSAIYDATSDTIAWVFQTRVGLGDSYLKLLLGTPSETPSFSVTTVYQDVTALFLYNTPSLAGNAAGDAFYVVAEVTGVGETDKVYHQFTCATLDGSWTGPTTYYDQTTNPPSPPPAAPELYPTWARVLSSGDLVVTTGNIYDVFGPTFCGVLVYLSPLTTPCGDPIQVSSDAQFRQSASEINPDYFQVGSNLYQVLAASQGEAKIGVFKRAKASVSGAWTEQDSASSPSNTHQSGYLNVVKNGTKLAILYLLDDFVSLKIVEFDTATDTYGVPTSALTIPNSDGTFGFVLKGSTYVVIGSGGTNTYVVTNTGGTWSSITNLFGAPTITIYGAILDVFGKLRFIGNQVSAHLDLWTLDNSLALTGTTHTFTNNMDTTKGRPSIVQISSTSYAVGYITTLAGHPFTVTVVTNTNTSPVYTPANTYVQPSADEEASYGTLVLGLGGALTAFFVRRNIVSVPVVNEVDRTTISAGTWAAYTTFYDAVADPPSGGTSDVTQIIRSLNPIAFGTGWSLALTMNTFVDPDTFQTGFFIDPCGAGQTLELVKSVVGGTAVPAMWLLTATGPTPISGAGDTGVLPVDPGDYVLTESVGPDGYTAGSYVCVGGSQTGNMVTIAEGDDVVCTITNTFGTPPFRASCPSPIYVVGTPYSSFVTVVGGVPPYTFAVLSGSLPTGLSLNATTGEISGTPSAAGPFTFVIEVTDDNGDHADTSSCSAGRCPGTRSII